MKEDSAANGQSSAPGRSSLTTTIPPIWPGLLIAYLPLLATGFILPGGIAGYLSRLSQVQSGKIPAALIAGLIILLLKEIGQAAYWSFCFFGLHRHLLQQEHAVRLVAARQALLLSVLFNPLIPIQIIGLMLLVCNVFIGIGIEVLKNLVGRGPGLAGALYLGLWGIILLLVIVAYLAGFIYWNLRWTNNVAKFVNERHPVKRMSGILCGLTLLIPSIWLGLTPCLGSSFDLRLFLYVLFMPAIGFGVLRYICLRIEMIAS